MGKKKRQRVEALVVAHAEIVGEAVHRLGAMVSHYLADEREFKADAVAIDELESRADGRREEAETELETSSMLRAYREDYIGLLDAIDRVANKAEGFSDTLTLVRPQFPEPLSSAVLEMCAATTKAWDEVPTLIHLLLAEKTDVSEGVAAIRDCESEVDKLQFETIRAAYKHDDLDRTACLEILISLERLASVSDRIENVADRLSLIASRRKLI